MIGVFFGADAPKKRVGFETSAVAVRAGRIAAIAGEHDTDVHLVGFRFEPFEEMLNAVPLLRAEACPFRIAEADPVLFFLSQITVRLADIQSTPMILPNPRQVSQAPNGELKLKVESWGRA